MTRTEPNRTAAASVAKSGSLREQALARGARLQGAARLGREGPWLTMKTLITLRR
jgi:hypothetical protein